MNLSARKMLIFAPVCILAFFVAGISLSNLDQRRGRPTPTETLSDGYSAPHKPLEVHVKTPAKPDLRNDHPSPTVAGSAMYWVCQDNSPLYAAMGLNQAVLKKLPFATPVTLLKEESDWVEVQVGSGSSGWVRRNQVSDRAPAGGVGPRPVDSVACLNGYFEALNAEDYSKAYDRLSFEFKRELPFKNFSAGYGAVSRVQMRVIRVQIVNEQSQIYFLEMLSEESPRPKAYEGQYSVVLEQNQWHIAHIVQKEIAVSQLEAFTSRPAAVETPPFDEPTAVPEEDEEDE